MQQTLTTMSDEQTLTSACIFVPNLAHNFPTTVSANLSSQYCVALPFDIKSTDRFCLLCSSLSKGFLNSSKSSSVKSSLPSMYRFTGSLSHIFILFAFALINPWRQSDGIPCTQSVVFSLSLFSLQAQDRSKFIPPVSWLVPLGSWSK